MTDYVNRMDPEERRRIAEVLNPAVCIRPEARRHFLGVMEREWHLRPDARQHFLLPEMRLDPEERRRVLEAMADERYTPPDPETLRQIREFSRQQAHERNAMMPTGLQMTPAQVEAMCDALDAMSDRDLAARLLAEPSLAVHGGTLATVQPSDL